MGHRSDDDDLPSWTDLGGDDDGDDLDLTADPLAPPAPRSSHEPSPVSVALPSSATPSAATDLTDVQDNPFVAAALGESRSSQLWRYVGVAAGVAVAVAVVVGLIVWATSESSGPSAQSASTAVAASGAVPTGSASAAPESSSCPATERDGVTTGNGPGGTTSGPGVIKAFDYAYYVTRSGAAARAVVSSDARVGSAAEIQGGIDKLAPGTGHCLTITDRGGGLWGVELTEIPPHGAAPVTIRQQIRTVDADGRTWISSIVPDPQG